ncbi:MAG: glycosyl transferase family 36 [bacterium]|jgi:cellobiose phosphorylase|nr:glycosyl transferase family 36 [bacterium]
MKSIETFQQGGIPLYANQYGHFSDDGKEYIITNPFTPKPWINVISNGEYSLMVSQTGGGCSWRGNAAQNRLTRLYQDLVKDSFGKYFYLRDLSTNSFWSLTFNPVQRPYDFFEVRHGTGYSVLTMEVEKIRSEMVMFVSVKDPIELIQVTLKNQSNQARHLDITSYFEWEAGIHPDEHREFHKLFMDTTYDATKKAIFLKKYMWGFGDKQGLHNNVDWDFVGFHAVSETPSSFDTDKESFLGMYGREHDPQAMKVRDLAARSGRFGDPVGALRNIVTLLPGEEKVLVYTIGATTLGKNEIPLIESTYEDPNELIQMYTNPIAAKRELEAVKKFWNQLLSGDHVTTPDKAFDMMTNTFAKYQAISGRIWAKSAYYQTSGGYGYRDQLQDCQIFLEGTPHLAKKQLRMHARKQFQEGDVLHWFVTYQGWGPRGNCSDDLLWLPFILDAYLEETLDFDFLDEIIPFENGGEASMYEHAKRAIQKSLTRFSSRGVPLMGSHDWNDGLSAVGPKMKGESFWMSSFLYIILGQFERHAQRASDHLFIEEMKKYRKQIKETFNKYGWNGNWYLMATTDAGLELGSKKNEEGKIFLMPNAWAIISDILPENRIPKVIESVTKHLLKEYGTLLNYPAFTVPRSDIGYVTRYAPGLRENGGVYTHAATWAVSMYAKAGEVDLAYKAYKGICPPNRSVDPDRYLAEPYVTCGNSDGPISPYFGRGGWSWYTGSAQWLHRVAVRDILGIKATYEGLFVDPKIPTSWPGYEYTRHFRNATYHFKVSRGPVKQLFVDQVPTDSWILPDFRDGLTHEVLVTIL